jgi:hypothetical protein
MLAIVQKANRSLVHVQDFENSIESNDRAFYFIGSFEGLINANYTVQFDVDLHRVVTSLPDCLPQIYGAYAGLSFCDGVLEFAASDISAINELYYASTETELIVSSDFFALARAIGQLEYDPPEARYFINHGFCRKGKTLFKEIYRLPPGVALKLDKQGSVMTESYLDHFNGVAVTYDVFKNAINSLLSSIVEKDPSFEEVVMYSGGVDSSVLLSLIKGITDVKAITYRWVPDLSLEPDVHISEKVAKKLCITQEFVDVDLDEISLNYLNDVILSMPFAAHLSINFKKLFESQKNQRARLWCGQNLDTLYYYAVTEPPWIINRFLLSDTYVRMLGGVEGHRIYRPSKKVVDALIKILVTRLYPSIKKQHVETPNTLDELIEYFNDAYLFLPLQVDEEHTEDRTRGSCATKNIGKNEIRKTLFDEELGCFFTGLDHKIQLQAIKLFNVNAVLPYSTPNMVHLLRNLKLSLLDTLYAKRFMYRYARELGVPKSYFSINKLRLSSKSGSKSAREIFGSTHFAIELRHRARELAKEIGFNLNATNTNTTFGKPQREMGVLWMDGVRERLSQSGVELKWPVFAQ